MDKFKKMYLVLGFVAMALLMMQCKKDHLNEVKLYCYYEQDTSRAIPGVWVDLDTSRISPHHWMSFLVDTLGLDSLGQYIIDTTYLAHTNYCNDSVVAARNYTNSQGYVLFRFNHPLVMNFVAFDTLRDINGNDSVFFSGTLREVKVTDGQDYEGKIILIQQN